MKQQSVSRPIRALNVFCGAGGSSLGARLAGVEVVAAIDMWPLARDTYKDNFPDTLFFRRKLEYVSPSNFLREAGPIDLLLASPECTNHTCAKGNGGRSEESRKTAFQVTRFARVLMPRWIAVENVVQMKSWDKYARWISKLKSLGYHVREQVLNAAHFGVPQSRKRLFVTCDLERMPPDVTPAANIRRVPAREIVDSVGNYRFSKLRTENRAVATIARAERAISQVGDTSPFLIVYYGTDGAGGWQNLDAHLRTVTTLDRFAYVRRNGHGHEMRMLQVPELKKAMGFPDDYKLEHGTRRDKIRLLGNAVCPPVMEAIIRELTCAPEDLKA